MAQKRIRPVLSFFIHIGLQLLLLGVRVSPAWLTDAWGRGISDLFFVLARKNVRKALANVRLALGEDVTSEQAHAIVRQSCRTGGQAVIDVGRFMSMPARKIRQRICLEGGGHLERALQAGRGAIGISGHWGSFVLLGARLRADGYRVSFVARPMREPGLARTAERATRASGIPIIFTRPVLSSFRRITAALARNEIVIIQIDQNFDPDGVAVSFFDRPAKVGVGPLHIAQRTGAVLLPMLLVNEDGGRYRALIEPAFEIPGAGAASEQLFAQQVVTFLEGHIRQRPGQWISWVHTRWRAGCEGTQAAGRHARC